MLLTLSLASAIATTAVPDSKIVFVDRVVVNEMTVTLGEVADLQALPNGLRERASDLALKVLEPRGQDAILGHHWLAGRARSLMPALTPWLIGPFAGQTVISFEKESAQVLSADCGAGTDGIAKGDAVTVRIVAEPFRIERKANAMQAAKPGGRFFARTADGSALSVQCTGVE